MEHENLFSKLARIMEEIDRLEKENPTGPDENVDPRIVELTREALNIQDELDPLVRVAFRNNPTELAEWDSSVRGCAAVKKKLRQPEEELEEEPEEEPDPQIAQLIDEAWNAQKELDPLVREAMKDNPKALAEWEEIMRVSYELEKEELEERKRLAEKNADKSGS